MKKKNGRTRLLSWLLSAALTLGCVTPALAADVPDAAVPDAGVEVYAASYKDGTYEGTGQGKIGAITLSLTIKDGKITEAKEVSQNETASYWAKAKTLIDALVGKSSKEEVQALDTVSSATLSSNGIKAAAVDALGKAEDTGTVDPVDPGEPADAIFAAGTGSKTDPYTIETAAQLAAFASSVNGGETYAGQYVKLDANIDLAELTTTVTNGGDSETVQADWTPIDGFAGTFNGANYTISNLKIGTIGEMAGVDNAGLFGDLASDGVIRDLGISDAAIYVKANGVAAGVLAAGTSARSVVENCWATGVLGVYSQYATGAGYGYIGGLIGANGVGSLTVNCWTDVRIAAAGSTENTVGGIVGWGSNNSLVINCAAFGDIRETGAGTGLTGVGGIAGFSSGAVYACYADNALHTDADSATYYDGTDLPVGGVVGISTTLAAAYNCYFNEEQPQTYYDDNEIEESLGMGFYPDYYSPCDSDHCYGLSAAALTNGTLAEKLAAALTEEEIAKGQAYFLEEKCFVEGYALNDYLSMAQGGWNSWEMVAGRLVPTGPAAVTPWVADFFDEGGDGSAANPYVLSSAEALTKFAAATAAGKLSTGGKYFALGANIALSGTWTPIKNFSGTFDGCGYTVSGLIIGTEEAPADVTAAGFFDKLGNSAAVYDLHLADVSISMSSTRVRA